MIGYPCEMEPREAVRQAQAAKVIAADPPYVILHAGDVIIPTTEDNDTRVRVLSSGTIKTESAFDTLLGPVKFVDLDGAEFTFSY